MIWILCIFTLFLSSCKQKPQETHYNEIVLQAPQANTSSLPQAPQANPTSYPTIDILPANPHAGLEGNMFTWAAPQGWKEEPGGGMRLATFHLLSDTKAIDCSIIALAGPAGGIEANLNRWMGQLGLPASDDSLKQLIISAQDIKTKDGLDVKVFNFTNLQAQADPFEKSMIVAMMKVDQMTVFVKMMGSIEAVKQNKDNFLKLLGSIVRK